MKKLITKVSLVAVLIITFSIGGCSTANASTGMRPHSMSVWTYRYIRVFCVTHQQIPMCKTMLKHKPSYWIYK